MVIISFEDTDDPAVREKQAAILPKVAESFVNQFAPGATYWGGVHVDRRHVHAHIAISNWSPARGCSLNWSKRDVAHMLSFRWLQNDPHLAGIGPGAWSKQERTVLAYPRSEACRILVGRLTPDPAAILAELEKCGEVERYQTKGGHPGVSFCGARITLKNLNFELAKAGVRAGFDRDFRPLRLTNHAVGDLEQQNRIDRALGVTDLTLEEYDRLCDLPDPSALCITDEDWQSLRRFKITGRFTDARHAAVLKRLCRTALIRRAKGAVCPAGRSDEVCSWVYGSPEHLTDAMKRLVIEIASVISVGGVLQSLLALLVEFLIRPLVEHEIDFP